jgi:hypothetical protein
MRSGTLKAVNPDPEQTESARKYHRNKQHYFPMLARAVPGPVDAILSPPSSMSWQAEPYRSALADRYPSAIDLSPAVSRHCGARSGSGAALEEVLACLSYAPSGREKDFRRLVIVDDTFATGTTAAALVTLLRDHGLPEACEVILACPLWLES